MLALVPTLTVVGSEIDAVEGCNRIVSDGSVLTMGETTIKCILTPGHTMGHVSFYATSGDEKVLFSGDTLFVGGCGRFFEGSPENMYGGMVQGLGALPGRVGGEELGVQGLGALPTISTSAEYGSKLGGSWGGRVGGG